MINEFDHGIARKVMGSSEEKPITGSRKLQLLDTEQLASRPRGPNRINFC